MRTTSRRIAAVIGAAALVMAVPVTPAAAQQDGTQLPDSMAKPPPLPADTPVPRGTVPDLPYTLKNQCIGALNNGGTDLRNMPWGQSQLRFDELHKFATGEGQLIGVIDTGVRQHPFFENRLRGGGDYVIAADQGIRDCDGHGTEVAGIIAANPPKESGLAFKGIAPAAQILSIRQSSGNYVAKRPTPEEPEGRESTAGTLETLAQAVVSAADQGVRVLNMSVDNCRPVSLGTITGAERQLQAALRYAFEEKDVVLVASAGNTGENGCPDQRNGEDPNRPTHIVTPPWFSDYVISVAAMDRNGDPAPFSVQGPWVTVAAPGTEIISLDPVSNGLANLQEIDGKRNPIQGTSFAAPYVAGLAALIRQRFPNLTAKQVTERIKITSSHPAAPGGRDNLVGWGMINPIGALTTVIPAEQGAKGDDELFMEMALPAAEVKNWAPMQVAIIGSSGGVLVLLLTLFVVHTVRRNRPGAKPEPRGMA
ncbi:type VII secretion-associated serine protease mycosin [Actinokineospora sp.]|uniref:type VII secretion-associated serine protease mycosin n=1 Tax=Actinokineospora sp. TaxID=1872133 RepID=UPI004037AAC6